MYSLYKKTNKQKLIAYLKNHVKRNKACDKIM